MLAAFATDPGPASELIRLSEHRSHVSRYRAILARPEPEFLRNALVAIRAVVAMIPEELRHALRHCRGSHGGSPIFLPAAFRVPSSVAAPYSSPSGEEGNHEEGTAQNPREGEDGKNFRPVCNLA